MMRFKGLYALVTVVLLLAVIQPIIVSATPPTEGIYKAGAWREGPAGAFACRNSIVYIGTGVMLQTWNISDMSNAVMTSEIEFSSPIQALEIDGDWLIGIIHGSLITIDISIPSQPLAVSTTHFADGFNYILCLGGGFAYVADRDGYFWAFDLTDPSAPIEASYDGNYCEGTYSMAYDNNKVFIACEYDSFVYSYDVSDPYAITLIDDLLFLDEGIKKDGLLAFNGILHVFTYGSGWLMYDIGNLAAGPTGRASPNAIRAHHFHGGLITTFENGVYKIYDPMSGPQHLASIDPGLSEDIIMLRHEGVHVLGLTSGGSLNIYNEVTDDQINIEFSDIPDNGGLYENIYVTGSFTEHRLNFFDIVNPADIELIGSVDLPWATNYLTVDNGFAVASCLDYGFMVIDITTGPPFAVRDTIPTNGYTKATGFHGGLLYVSMSDNIMRSYDISTPGAAVLMSETLTTEYARDLDFVDDTMIFMGYDVLQSYNLSDPGEPMLTGSLTANNSHYKQISIADNMIYACGLNTGLQAVELMPTGELKPIIAYPRPPYTYGLRIQGDRLYTATGPDGVTVYDITNPLDILPIYEEDLVGFGHSVAMWGRVFVIRNGVHGFSVYIDDMVTPVSMTSLAATRIPGGATVTWNIHSEQHDEAFHVWRGTTVTDRVRKTETPLSSTERFTWTDPAPPASPTLYWLEQVTEDGTSTWYGPASLAQMDLPQHAVMDKPWPNPFNPEVALRVILPAQSHLVVTIHDLRGRRVATLHDGQRDAGDMVLTWQGRNDEGRPMHSGTYFAKMKAGDEQQVQKLMLVR